MLQQVSLSHTSPWLYVGQKPGQQVHFKIIDYGHARLSHQRVRRKLPKIPVFEQIYQKWVITLSALLHLAWLLTSKTLHLSIQ